MASKVEICNLALSHIGVGVEITDLDTERSQEAIACRRFYEICKDSTLRDADWSFSTDFVTLQLIETEPTTEWEYSYRYPVDCIFFRRILSGTRVDSKQTRIPFKFASSTSGQIILTDEADAVAEITTKIDDVNLYPSDFKLALSYRLAMMLAPRLSRGDASKMMADIARLYLVEVSKANASSGNEESDGDFLDAEIIRARE